MSNNDTTSYDEFNPGMQDWFFDELQGNSSHPSYDFNSSFNMQMDDGPPESPPAASSNNMHAPQNSDQPSQMQSSHSNNIYQGNGNQMDDMMPSTSDYGMQQHSMNQQSQIHHQSQQPQQFETLRPYNPDQMQSQGRYQGNQMDMVFDSNIDLEFMMNEPTTSSAMSMECGIPQDYGQQDQQYQQQMNPNESQWMSMDSTPHHQQSRQMTVVYTSTSQSMPKVPDPGGHPNNQSSQILNYNPPQQITQTGLNGGTILTSMQPVQQIHSIIQPSQYDMNSNNYVQYVDQSGGSQPYPSHEQGMHQQTEQIRMPPKSKPKTTKAAAKKKNNQQPPAPTSGIEAMMMRMHAKMVEVRLPPESSMRMFDILQRASEAGDREKQGYDVSMEMKLYEQQLTELLNNADIAPKDEVQQPVVQNIEMRPSYASQPAHVASGTAKKKKPTKAELQQKKADAVAAAQPIPFQTPIAVTDSRIQIHAQDSNAITVNYEGKMMKAVMVSTANGTATYQILPESEQGTPMGLVQPSSSGRGPLAGRPIPVMGASSIKNEADNRIMTIVTEVVDSCKGNKKVLAPRAKGKKSIDEEMESKVMVTKQGLRSSDPLCVPSTSSAASKSKLSTVKIAQMTKPIRDRRENRRRKVAEFLRKMKENLETTNIDSPFTEKQDVLQRLLPYGFHLEPNLSDKAVETYENELFRHQVHNELQKRSIEKRMENLFLREAMQPIPDVELNMLLAIDLEYERKLYEEDKVKAGNDLDSFIRDSEVIRSGVTMDDINKTKQALASMKPKITKPHVKGLVYEASKFDEETYRRRRQELQNQMITKRRPSSESSSSSEDISEPPSPIKEQTMKLPPPAPRKYRSPSASSGSSSTSSDETFAEKKRPKKDRKANHTSESSKTSSPIRKSPKKNDYSHRSISPAKPLKEKTALPSVTKPKVPPELPPGYSSNQGIRFGDYKIPKLGETPKSQMPKLKSPKKEVVTTEPKESNQKTESFVKPFTIKLHDYNAKHVNEKESEKNKISKPDRNPPSNRPLTSIKLSEIQSKSSSESSLHKEREPIKTKISSKAFDSSQNVPSIKIPKERKEVENKKIVSENVHISTEYPKKPEPTPIAAPLKLKISVGTIKTEAMTEEERKKEKKRKKKEKKERERLEREGKEKDEDKELKKLKKEKRRAEKEERKRQEQLQREAGSQMSNVSSVNSNPATPATPDQKRLVVRIKMQEPQNAQPEPPKQVQNDLPPPPPPSQPLGIPKLTMKLPKLVEEDREHREHKKEKKEKKKHKKEESKAESSKTPPLKIPRITIKLGQNSSTSSGNTAPRVKTEGPPVLSFQRPLTSQEPMSTTHSYSPPTLTNQSIHSADLFNDISFSSTGASVPILDNPLLSRSDNASSLSLMSKPKSELEVKDLKAVTGNILLRIRDQ